MSNDVLPNEKPFLTSNSVVAVNYTFDASARTITINEPNFKRLLYVVNSTYGEVLYNPYDNNLLGTLSGNSITLDYPTETFMSDNDNLLVLYEASYSNNISQRTSFDELNVVQPIAYIEGSGLYNFVPANFRSFTSSGGATGAESRMLYVQTGTSVGGYGAIQSFRAMSHKVGKSITARFAGYFISKVADSWQGMGLLSLGEEMSFGYNGTSFGIWNRYGGLPEVRTITVTAPSGGSTNLTLTLNGVAYTIPLTAGTTAHNAYEIADWLNTTANQSVWGADQIGSTVIINALSDGAKSGTYSFSHATATGTVTQNTAGVTKTSDFIAQTSWNGSNLSGTIDPAKGNLYQISYQNMGFGNIEFSVLDPALSKFVVVHTIRVANSGTILKVPNPSMRVGFYAASIGSTTNLKIYGKAFSVSLEGVSNRTRNPRALEFTQNLSTTNYTNIITIRNRRTYNYYNNQVTVLPLLVTFASESTKTVTVEIRSSSDTGVEQNFASAGNGLVIDYDTTATTITAGSLLAAITLPPGGSGEINLQDLEIELPPTLYLSVQAKRSGGAASDVTATIIWYEDL